MTNEISELNIADQREAEYVSTRSVTGSPKGTVPAAIRCAHGPLLCKTSGSHAGATPLVTLVGAGPGDPELLTLKGRRILEEADVVVHDRLIGTGVLNYVKPEAELINVGKSGGSHPVTQREIEKILVEKAREGKKVARLKGGDPFLFGRGGEEVAALAEAGIACEVVPGVTSAIAVPAYAGIPVTHRGYSSSLHIVTAHKQDEAFIDYETLAHLKGTLVFLMGSSKIGEIRERLVAAGMDAETPAAVIENGTTSRQRHIFTTLDNLPERAGALGIQSPAVIVIGQAVALGEFLNRSLRSRRLRPLDGKRVIVPSVSQKGKNGGRLAALLRLRGAEVMEIGVSRIETIDSPLPALNGYEWIVFTSAAGVEKFFERLKMDCRDVREIGSARIAAVGPVTAEALEARGLRVDLIPPVYNGTALGEVLCSTAKGRILLLRAENGAPELALVLRSEGMDFDEAPVYRTVPIKVDTTEIERTDAVAFTCASSVRNFAFSCRDIKIKAACIGERTAKAASDAGYKVYTSKKATLEDLAETVEEVVKEC